MIRWVLALSAWWWIAHAAQAQELTVRSGEHAGFSRLVIDIGPGRTWSLGGSGQERHLTFDPAPAGFDTDAVFDLIPRTRLLDLVGTETLSLDLRCACAVSAYRFQGRYLVVDIADPPDTGAADDGAATPPGAPREAEALPDLATLLMDRPAPDVPAFGFGDGISEPSPTTDISLEDAARLMAEQLARAAATGLLEAAPARPLSDADPRPHSPSVETTPNPPEAAPQPDRDTHVEISPPRALATQITLPVRAETAFDAAQHSGSGAEPQRPSLGCSGQSLNLQSWSRGSALYDGLGSLRHALYDDRGVFQPAAATELARHYLYFGFGAEAAFWLGQLSDPPGDLLAIARLVDGVEGRHFPVVSDPLGCDAEALLWRFLDGALPDGLSDEQVAALQRATSELPLPLRDQLGPRIARALSAAGHGTAARNIRDMLLRGGRVAPQTILHLDRDLGLPLEDGVTATRDDLALALRDDGAHAAEAMAQALAFDRDIGAPASERRLLAAEALLRETGDDPARDRIWAEIVLARAARGDTDQALALLDSHFSNSPERQGVLTALFADRLTANDDASLMMLALRHGADWGATGSDAGRVRVAAIAHLRDLGLHGAADALRGQHRMLILPIRPAPPPTERDRARTAWLTGDWAQVEETGHGPHGALAARMQDLAAPTVDLAGATQAPPDLSNLTNLVDDARNLRGLLETLLATPSPQWPAGTQ